MERKGFVILDLICLKIFVKFNPNYLKRNERKTNEYKHNQNKARILVSVQKFRKISKNFEKCVNFGVKIPGKMCNRGTSDDILT